MTTNRLKQHDDAELVQVVDQTRPEGLTIRSAAQILNMEMSDNSLVGDRIISMGQSTAVLGCGGVGKSRLMLWLAACLLTGREWLGFPVKRIEGPILFLQSENSARRLQDDLSGMVKVFGEAPQRELVLNGILIQTPESPADNYLCIGEQEARGNIEAAIRTYGPSVVVFDPLIDFFAGDNENEARQMRKRTSCLRAPRSSQAQTRRCSLSITADPVRLAPWQPKDGTPARSAGVRKPCMRACERPSTWRRPIPMIPASW